MSTNEEFWKLFDQKLSTTLDIKLEDVARKSDLQLVKDDVKHLCAENSRLNLEVATLSSKLEQLDRNSRRNRIVVRGITSNDNIAASSELQSICKDVLKVEVKIVDIFKMKADKTFVVTLESPKQVDDILAKRTNLRGSAVFIEQDLTEKQREVRFKLRSLARQLKRVRGIKIRIGGPYIYINDKKYTWAENAVVASSLIDANILKQILIGARLEIDVTFQAQRPRTTSAQSPSTSSQYSL